MTTEKTDSTQLETMASYISPPIIRHIIRNAGSKTVPQNEQLEAAVFFADINGFTPLTESMTGRGPAGTEALSRLLNTYFGQLIDLISLHGGEVVKFAGDALLALWPTGESHLENVVLRAAQCGLTVQEALHEFPTRTDTTLSLRIAIGVGQVIGVYLGGVFDRWEYLVTGNPLNEVHHAQHHVPAGRVILTPSAWEQAHYRCQAEPLVSGDFLLDHIILKTPRRTADSPALNVKMRDALYFFLPGAIRDRIAAGQSGWLAELRLVTVLFINLPELDHTTPTEEAQRLMQVMQNVIYHYEGSVNKISVDDKGVTLVAALGLPPFAHEDDPVRGVQTALTIRKQLDKLGVSHAIGLTTGRAFCGTVGNNTRREYTMLGDVVNLAARLMQAAHSKDQNILCDDITRVASHEQIIFNALPAIQVKGKTERVAIFTPVAEGKTEPIPTYRPNGHDNDEIKAPHQSIVGRKKELDIIVNSLEKLTEGQCNVVIIEGEAGIGKSRLVEESMYQAQRRDLKFFLGLGDALDKSTPYHAWRPIFAELFDIDLLNDSAAQKRTKILDRLTVDFPDLLPLAPLLSAVLPLDLADNELTSQMSGQVRSNNIQSLLTRLLCEIAAIQPLFIVLEDAHWLDSASWALAKVAWQDVTPLMLLIATRPLSKPQPSEYHFLCELETSHHFILDTMPAEEIEQLICLRLGVKSLPAVVSNLIQVKAEGHPFFSEELAYALRDSGLIRIVGDECFLGTEEGNLQLFDFPDTIQGVITSRIDRLSPQQTLTLKVASVIGRVFAFRILRDVHPIPDDRSHLMEYLNKLERLDITPLETPEPDLSYIFKHIITQEVAYNLMSFAQRHQLHRSVAQWYEKAYGWNGSQDIDEADTHTVSYRNTLNQRDSLAPYYPLLAHHWSKAQDDERAMHYFGRAGEQALRQFANQEAVAFFQKALAFDDLFRASSKTSVLPVSTLRRARWERQLGEAYIGLGHLKEGRENLERAAARLDRQVPAKMGSLLFNLLREFGRQIFHRLRPGHLGVRSRANPNWLEAARTYDRLGEVYYFANLPFLTLYATVRGLNLAEHVSPSPELARLYSNMGVAVSLLPLHKQARHYGRRALEIAEQTNDLYSQAWVNLVHGLYYTGNGLWKQGRESLGRARRISKQLGAQRMRDQIINSLGLQANLEGAFQESLDLFQQSIRTSKKRGDSQLYTLALAGQAQALISLGRLYEALLFLKQTDANIDNAQQIEKIWIHGLYARVYVQQGQMGAANEAALAAADLIARSQPSSYLNLEGYAGVSLVALTLFEIDRKNQRRDAAHRAIKVLRGFSRVFAVGRPRYWRYQGWLESLEGKSDRAKNSWQTSLDAAQNLAMPYEEGLTHYQIGRFLRLDNSLRANHLNQAAAIFERLNASYDLARLQEIQTGI